MNAKPELQITASRIVTVTVGDIFNACYNAIITSNNTTTHGNEHADAHHTAGDALEAIMKTQSQKDNKTKWNNVEDLLPSNDTDVEVVIGETGRSLYGDSLRRIAWFNGDWVGHDSESIDVEKWRELQD